MTWKNIMDTLKLHELLPWEIFFHNEKYHIPNSPAQLVWLMFPLKRFQEFQILLWGMLIAAESTAIFSRGPRAPEQVTQWWDIRTPRWLDRDRCQGWERRQESDFASVTQVQSHEISHGLRSSEHCKFGVSVPVASVRVGVSRCGRPSRTRVWRAVLVAGGSHSWLVGRTRGWWVALVFGGPHSWLVGRTRAGWPHSWLVGRTRGWWAAHVSGGPH